MLQSPNSGINDWIGLTSADAVQRLFMSLRNVVSVTLASYSHLPMLQNRLIPSMAESAVINEAIELRSELQLPFWDCVMLSISKSKESVDSLLDVAGTHVSLRDSDIILDRASVSCGMIQERAENERGEKLETCVVSEVQTSGGLTMHLPMMDFHCAPTAAGQAAAIAVSKRIFPGGAVLLKSGESFHAYGKTLISTTEFFEFLGHALLYSPIIDRAYIAHQLIERRCALRISGRNKPIPMTVAIV